LTVYRLLKESKLDNYYKLNERPGISLKSDVSKSAFEFLDDPETVRRILNFSSGKLARVRLQVPQIYCSSCIWLLENLYRLQPAVVESKVDFVGRELAVSYREDKLSLRSLVELLASLGYTPNLTLESIDQKPRRGIDRRLFLQTGIAGFAFANIMLLSFPDYLDTIGAIGTEFTRFFGVVSLILALPVLLYSSADFFQTAWRSLQRRQMHLDVPISLGIAALFFRSLYDIASAGGTGFLDSMSGLVFFLLIGRIIQARTYRALSFDRDYRAYFPLFVTKMTADKTQQVAASDLVVGDRIAIRNGELIVADAILISAQASIDYSFVSGEADLVACRSGDLVYAGGRVSGELAELEVIKEVSQSYLVTLWNSQQFKRERESKASHLVTRVARYFTSAVLLIAAVTFVLWLPEGLDRALLTATAVLIVACPCALALTIPFTYGTVMQIMGAKRFYLRNQGVVEGLARAETVIFDKTGTMTVSQAAEMEFEGPELSAKERHLIKTLASQSTHPLSRKITEFLRGATASSATEVNEIAGAGVEGIVNRTRIRLGSRAWIDSNFSESCDPVMESGNEVWVSIDGKMRGKFVLRSSVRRELEKSLELIRQSHETWLLSGDGERERTRFAPYFDDDKLLFRQSPHDKLQFMDNLRNQSKRLIMVGDGLNDAGALAASDVGIAVSDKVASFTPASDAILDGESLWRLPAFIGLSKRSLRIVAAGFAISFLYNFVGLYFAVTGQLSPLLAAVLMPLSSVTVVGFAVLATRWAAKREGLG
jgi:Cu+-exporting ATPase